MPEITRIDELDGGLRMKREDLACNIGKDFAAGAKVRQYLAMCAVAAPGAALVVGCSAYSCQQIYIADARKRTGRRAVVFVPARKEVTAATQYCIDAGCEIEYVRPGYLSVVRSRARDFAKANEVVRWNSGIASADAFEQALRYEGGRVVVPVGSGAMLAGILAAFSRRAVPPPVLGVRVSPMTSREDILAAVDKINTKSGKAPSPEISEPPFELVDYPDKYDNPRLYVSMGGVRLDPWYAAKAAKFLVKGDTLWNTGRRPYSAMKE